jgi:4'-phosphopantetheinyl transferase
VLKYYHVRDAKLSLGSHLLKRYAISRYCRVPWRRATATRNGYTKPVFRADDGSTPLAFNVSHQAGLVALVAVHGYAGPPPPLGPPGDAKGDGGGGAAVEIGVDVVCTSERRDRDQKMVAEEGWPRFVDIHADVLSPAEASYLKYQVLAAVPGLRPRSTVAEIVDFKLRAFYALWCLREAFVKMTGEALLAEWLPELQFRNFRPPPLGSAEGGGREDDEEEPGVVRKHDVVWKGRRVDDVQICLRNWGDDYMTCTAVMTPGRKEDGLGFELGPFVEIELETILGFAELQPRNE